MIVNSLWCGLWGVVDRRRYEGLLEQMPAVCCEQINESRRYCDKLFVLTRCHLNASGWIFILSLYTQNLLDDDTFFVFLESAGH